jgi:hypothetical protein
MSRRPLIAVILALVLVGALVGSWLATRGAPDGVRIAGPADEDTRAEPVEHEEARAVPETPEPPPVAAQAGSATPAEPDAPAEEVVPLENLLRVPDAEAFPMVPETAAAPGTASAPTDERGGFWPDDRVRIEASRQADKNEIDGKTEREQVDAGASVRVDESTRVRGGVRIERDPDEGSAVERETAPMIGIEKRF